MTYWILYDSENRNSPIGAERLSVYQLLTRMTVWVTGNCSHLPSIAIVLHPTALTQKCPNSKSEVLFLQNVLLLSHHCKVKRKNCESNHWKWGPSVIYCSRPRKQIHLLTQDILSTIWKTFFHMFCTNTFIHVCSHYGGTYIYMRERKKSGEQR